MSPVGKTVALCLALVAMVVGAFVYTTTRTPVPSLTELREAGVFVLPQARNLQPFTLTTADGRDFGVDDLRGRWSFLFFGSTHCPDICPTTMAVMAEAERRLEETDKFHGVLVTVDPQRDTPDVLAAYVAAFSRDFTGLTGSRPQIAALASQVSVAFAKVPAEDGGYSMDHSGQIVLINPAGQYHGVIKMPHTSQTIADTFLVMAAQH